MSSRVVQSDDVFVSRYHVNRHEGDNGRTYHTLDQPSRKLILERNAELRKNKGALKDLSFGRQLASIPYLDYYAMKQKHPRLNSPDAKDRSDEMMRLLRLPEYRHLLV